MKPGPKPRPPAERFWDKVNLDGPGGCWLWTAYLQPNGYAIFQIGRGEREYAHRWAYEAVVGPIPDGMEIDHLCRVRHCVNPVHLEPVTRRTNQLRGFSASGTNVRKTHCPAGHEYDEANTHVRASGWRQCRVCDREYQQRKRAGARSR